MSEKINTTEILIKEIIGRYAPDVEVLTITALTPDASARRYYTAELTAHPKYPRSLVCMVFDGVNSPEASGAGAVRSDQAYVELSTFFLNHGINVPELYFDARQDGVLLIENFGSTLLFHELSDSAKSVEHKEKLLFASIDQIFKIQSITPDDTFFAFQRSFSGEIYKKEMQEFWDYYFTWAHLLEDAKRDFHYSVEWISNELLKMPPVLSHRDFHAWNLMVLPQQYIGVIDFQDALMATAYYDIVSLLNDRDMDSLLGRDLYYKALNYFFSLVKQSMPKRDYLIVLLQRDLKVAGRFAKLEFVMKKLGYAKWIPGTVRRIISTIDELSTLTEVPKELVKLRQRIREYSA